MLTEYEHKLHKQLRQLSCDAYKCDGTINQDREMCMAIHALCHFYERTHEKEISNKYMEFCNANQTA